MALTVRHIIETARDRHPLFAKERHPDRVLMRALSHEERRMVDKILQVNPSAIADKRTIELDGFDFEEGFYLPAHHLIHAVEVVPNPGRGEPFPAIRCNWTNRLDTRYPLSYALHGNHIFLARTAAEWKDVARVNVSYAPIPVDMTTLEDYFWLPDNAEVYLVAFLAHFMARRQINPRVDPSEASALREERATAEKDLLDAWARQSVAKIIRNHKRR